MLCGAADCLDQQLIDEASGLHYCGEECHTQALANEAAVEEQADHSEDTACDACGSCEIGEAAQAMVLCNGCDHGFHCGCVGLCAVPASDWFCAGCAAETAREISEHEQRARRWLSSRNLLVKHRWHTAAKLPCIGSFMLWMQLEADGTRYELARLRRVEAEEAEFEWLVAAPGGNQRIFAEQPSDTLEKCWMEPREFWPLMHQVEVERLPNGTYRLTTPQPAIDRVVDQYTLPSERGSGSSCIGGGALSGRGSKSVLNHKAPTAPNGPMQVDRPTTKKHARAQ